MDIALSFVTAYEHKGVVVTEPKRVAQHYLKTYFLLDLLATFPINLILVGRGDHEDLGRLAKASKLPRLLR